MPNMSQKKVPVPEQAPEIRAHNFEEVTLGYTAELAEEEASRCLNCPNMPCVSGCPVNIRIPAFIKKITECFLFLEILYNRIVCSPPL